MSIMRTFLILAAWGAIIIVMILPPPKNPCAEPIDLKECLGPISYSLDIPSKIPHWK